MTEMKNDWQEEQQRIDLVLKEIDKKTSKLQGNASGLKEEVVQIRKTFWEDVTVNLDEPDDVIETMTSIRQQSELLSERERSHRQNHKQLKILGRLKSSPYFGRIDFLEKGEPQEDCIYIGIGALMDENDEEFLIYDWRAPISSLYYDYFTGPAVYTTPSGTVEGSIHLKRQFIIRDGRLKSMFDTGVTIGDELLQEVLSNNANTQMKSIVATIQKEQNQIIRNETSRTLIVQGVAGSGKTSAALQRVAYILYRYKDKLSSDNIMLFSPNPLFNSYVASVLPELGEENIQQTTFQEYVTTRLGELFILEDIFSQTEFLLTGEKNDAYKARVAGVTYKASSDFKKIIDDYVDILSTNHLVFKPITFRKEKLFSAEQIKEHFYSLPQSISIPNRINLVSEWLLKELGRKEREERKKNWVIEESELLDKEDFLKIYQKLQKKNQFSEDTFNDFDREQQLIAKLLVKKYFKPIRQMIKKLAFIDGKNMYKQLFEKSNLIFGSSYAFPDEWKVICRYTTGKIENNEMPFEDTTPYLYLQDQLEGRKSHNFIRHLFIDEAQDYSPFQLAYFKQLFPNSRMTILGDMNQAIFAQTADSPNLLSTKLYCDEKFEKITLTRSYRSTRQIIEFTKWLLPGGEAIQAFNRDGVLPTLNEVSNEVDLKSKVLECIKKLKEKGHQTIAIICKTAKESKEAYDLLQKDLPILLMDKETFTFNKGVLVLPTYLAKGIEFDAVVIYNCSNTQYKKGSDQKLFYTACTRAMHELHLFSLGRRSEIFDEVPNDTFLKE